MIQRLFSGRARRILILIGAAGILALIGAGLYEAAMNAVTPSVARAAIGATSRFETRIEVAAKPNARAVILKGRVVYVDIADTEASREQGLSGRQKLEANHGMLFVFPADGRYAFWMKDMLFSIDMVWLSSDGRVIYIVKGAPPDSYPATFLPERDARYVLELPAGWTASHRLKIGDKAVF